MSEWVDGLGRVGCGLWGVLISCVIVMAVVVVMFDLRCRMVPGIDLFILILVHVDFARGVLGHALGCVHG